MGTTMDNPACEWVRSRLPLWMGAGDDADDSRDEGGDLSVEDRRSIDRHLGGCPACRAHRSGMVRALEALGVTAGALPVDADAPSLWPSLERRIAAHHARDGSRTPPVHQTAAGRERSWAALDGERPLQSAWMQDTLKEVLEAAGLGALSGRSEAACRRRPGRSARRVLPVSWRIVGASLAASVLALLVVLPASWRRQVAAEADIANNSAPVVGVLGPPVGPPSEATDSAEPVPEHDRGIPPGQLAQAEPIRPPAEPPPAADAPAGAKPGTPPRLDYDLEPVRPMPLDGRDAKPVY
jgi:hypothetical protein